MFRVYGLEVTGTLGEHFPLFGVLSSSTKSKLYSNGEGFGGLGFRVKGLGSMGYRGS